MGIIQEYIRKMREKKAMKEGYAEEQHMVEGFEQRKMGANERELLRYQEEDRQKRIKAMLEQRRKVDNDKIWSGQENNPVYTGNVVAGQKKLFSGGNMFSQMPDGVHNQDVVHTKNLFHNQKNIFGGKKK